MGVFEQVKQNVTVREAAEFYGFKPNRSGLIRCIFHNDGTPSMKVDRRYYCFGCGCTGDVIDFIAQLFGLRSREAALSVCSAGFCIAMSQSPGLPKILAIAYNSRMSLLALPVIAFLEKTSQKY